MVTCSRQALDRSDPICYRLNRNDDHPQPIGGSYLTDLAFKARSAHPPVRDDPPQTFRPPPLTQGPRALRINFLKLTGYFRSEGNLKIRSNFKI